MPVMFEQQLLSTVELECPERKLIGAAMLAQQTASALIEAASDEPEGLLPEHVPAMQTVM